MKIGADTGFFIALIDGAATAQTYWNEVISEQSDLILSVLTVHELLVYFYKQGKGDLAAEWLAFLRSLDNVQILTVTEEIAQRSAGYRHGLGIPTVDSLIITQGCSVLKSRGANIRCDALNALSSLAIYCVK